MQSAFLKDELSNRRKAETITAYVSPELKAALEKWAKKESRSVSSLITHLVTTAVEKHEKEEKEE